MAKDYSAVIEWANRELSPKEKIMFKDVSDSISLNDILLEQESIVIDVDTVCVIKVHNEKSERKEYPIYLVVDKDGNRYSTSSESFYAALSDILDEMADYPDLEYSIKVFGKESKNYKGKSFITCRIV